MFQCAVKLVSYKHLHLIKFYVENHQVIAVYDTMTREQQMERLKVDGLNIVKTLINLTISICNEKVCS